MTILKCKHIAMKIAYIKCPLHGIKLENYFNIHWVSGVFLFELASNHAKAKAVWNENLYLFLLSKSISSTLTILPNQEQLLGPGLLNIHGWSYIRNSLLFPQLAALASLPLSTSILPLSSTSFRPDWERTTWPSLRWGSHNWGGEPVPVSLS